MSDLEERKRKAREEMATNRQEEHERDDWCVEFVGMTCVDTPSVPVAKQTGLILDEMCLKHHCSFGSVHGDAECPDRLRAIQTKVKEEGLVTRCVCIPLRPAKDDEMKSIHSDEYLAKLKTIPDLNDEELKSFAESYDSIFMCKESFEVASNVTGGVIDLVKQIHTGQLQNGFAMIRPPGHHAGHNEANGYCLLNNTAIAAKQAVENWNVKRLLIIDWDVHHGQGIQRAFYNDPRVLYFSIHCFQNGEFCPYLPESNLDYIGDGNGKGYNINVPWNEFNMGDAEYLSVFQQILLPVALEFKPELVLVSAGFDSAKGDPKGHMAVSPSFYSHLTQSLMGLANGKLALILEGGYNHTSLAVAAAACLKTLLGDPCTPVKPLTAPCPGAKETIFQVIDQLQPHWKCFQTALSSRHKSFLAISPEEKIEGFLVNALSKSSLGDTTTPSVPPQRTCLVYDDRMKRHRIGSHPERPERISSIFKKHEEYGLVDRCLRVEARHASIEELALCHSEDYIKDLSDTRKLSPDDLARKQFDYNSIYLCPDTYDSALLATGSLLNVVDTVLTGKSRSGVAIIRPPGHHADKGNAAGFCFFNSVPIATKYAQKQYNLQRILIVDWDVHHGNGTQAILETDPAALYISLHRYDNGSFYPGSSGAPCYVGHGPGEGYNINVAWNYGPMGDAEYLAAFRHIVMPIAYEYNPELVLVSAGFDAARGDPLGGYDITPEGYGLMTHMLSSLAGGKVIVVLEGGYNLMSISESMARCTHSLLGDPCVTFDPGLPKEDAYGSILSTLECHSKYWRSAAYHFHLLKHQAQKMEIVLEARLAAEELAAAKIKAEEEANIKQEASKQGDAALTHLTESLEAVSLLDTKEGTTNIKEEEAEGGGMRPQETGGGDQQSSSGDVQGDGATAGSLQGAQGDGGAGAGGNTGEPMGAAGGSDQPTGFQIGALLSDLDSEEATLFAVTPLSWCPHLEAGIKPLPPKGLDVTAECLICSGGKENWVCLTCYQVFCGRYINKHMVQHGTEANHPVVLSYADLSVWCYGCEQYVHNEMVLPVKQAAHLRKFGVDMPT